MTKLNRAKAVQVVFDFVKDAHPFPDRYKSWLEGLADERLQYFYGLVLGVTP